MSFYTFADVSQILGFAFGVLLNCILIVLVLKSGNVLSDQGYRPIILQVCVTDLLCVIVTFFYMPLYLPAGEYHFCYTTGFFNDAFKDAPLFTKIMFKAWFFSVYITLYTPGVQFLYRYLVLCREREPSYRLYATLFSFAVVFQLAFCIVSFGTTDYVPRTHNEPYREYILADNPSNVDLLVSKATLPIVGILIPVCIDSFGGSFNAHAKDIIFIVQTVPIWMPVFNPLLTIFLIESYRTAIFRCCKSEMSSTKVSNVTAMNLNAL
ncbi:serpentine type 7TM GPCR chemoreceptor str domain-containing protein [Ditylenchus destructor]|uniref:Serpentine type 7TM GPCR chemoreceptor str domain-containing protein n=1 Tax=Ditylenchus destructor TaxID=166010 RepID=A0AAD4MQC3_9BILA|nr:serpentine type 7TM GPCR chemoreceptor str domain-containing protein [Ditylenchus destructor]